MTDESAPETTAPPSPTEPAPVESPRKPTLAEVLQHVVDALEALHKRLSAVEDRLDNVRRG
jgi:hypothetical protein